MRYSNAILNLLGVFFIALSITSYANSIADGYSGQILWFCYFFLMLIGIGILLKNTSLILIQLNIMTIPLLIWAADFFFVLLTKGELFGLTNYFFIPGPVLGKIVTAQHLFTLPLTFFAMYLIKIKKKDVWKFSFVEMAFIFILTRVLTSEQYNINCVFRNCMKFSTGPAWVYPILWFLVALILVFVTNYLIIRIKFLKAKD